MGQGKENAKLFLVENGDVAREVEERLRATLNVADVRSRGGDEEETVEMDD
jgi:recombination protein RecA